MDRKKTDLIIVGGGILGAFHAYHALARGLRVRLFEKNRRPQGASVRNFGQIVPSGMKPEWQRYGRKSLELYRQLHAEQDITARFEGSIYIASDEEEMTLLEELHEINRSNDYHSVLLDRKACLARYEGLRSDYCRGGLFFPEELSVDPRQMVGRVLDYLQREKGLAYHPGTLIVHAGEANGQCVVEDSRGGQYASEKVIICNGSDFQFLFPDLFEHSDLEVSKLQMIQTAPQPRQVIPGNVLTGWSIRRYESFRDCPSYPTIKTGEDEQAPWKKWGVHLLFKQAADGSVIIGDSHRYADASEADELGFDVEAGINAYLLAEAAKIFDLEDWTLQKEWLGFYSQSKREAVFRHTVDRHIHIVTGIGGKGMTTSAGFARESLQGILF